MPLHGGARSGLRPGSGRATDVTTKCTKDGCKPGVATCMSGADLSAVTSGKVPSESQPCSRTGENPPYGMRGGIEETSASFEARYAPRSYPTLLSSETLDRRSANDDPARIRRTSAEPGHFRFDTSRPHPGKRNDTRQEETDEEFRSGLDA